MKALSKFGRLLLAAEKSPSRLTNVWLTTPRRNYRLPVAMLEGEMKLKKKDNVSSESELIYRMPKSKRLSIVATVCNLKVCITPTLLAIIYAERNGKYLMHSSRMLDSLSESMMFLTETQCYVLGSTVFVLGVALNRYICWHPLRIYMDKNTDKFTAVFMNSLLPWRTCKYEFTTVKPAFKTFILGRKRALLEDGCFKTAAYQYKMCGSLPDDGRL